MKKSLIDTLKEYFSCQPIEKAWLFGSVSRGEDTPESDLDILVKFDPDGQVGLFKHAAMISDLESLLKKSVDLVSEGSLFPWVRENVDKDKILIYERKATR
ncbi:MAG: nucleotidyltransferase domain-containing protein [Muribaculaceae bacterium]|nr:nucleotidyltransferase domain-containing protein [Muribaculaceae bacterium]